LVQDANLLYSTVDAALRETMLNLQDLRNRINNVDGSDHSVKLRNWKADMDRAVKSLSEIEKRMNISRAEFKTCEGTKSLKISEAEKARVDLEAALQNRTDAAEALQDNTPDHLSEILRAAERKRTEAERTKLSCESSISTNESQIVLMNQRVSDIETRISKQEEEIVLAEASISKLELSISTSKSELVELKGKSEQFDEEHQILTNRRDQLVGERASLRATLDQLSKERETIKSRINELNSQIRQKAILAEETAEELADAGVAIPSEDIQLPTIAEAERAMQGLERRLGNLGNVNMLAIDQYDETAERISALIEDGKTLRSRRDHLVSIAEQLEDERKTRFMTVFEHVNNNFSRVYEILQPSGSGKLRLENSKNPFEGGLEMACVPPGKSRNTRRSALSGGEKSMAALALIFAIQDYEPSPFYYFDEVDQNLDPFNSGRIATLCRIRSERAQFIMVTLRKVSLSLADHHIGITHAGDGCSRRITDFDRAAAIELSEELEAEKKAQEESKAEKEAMPDLPDPQNMPKVPEPLENPVSLGGLAERAGVEKGAESHGTVAEEEDSVIGSLRERTGDWTEDIDEKEKVIFHNNGDTEDAMEDSQNQEVDANEV
tara:strand:- start:896 stop:2725 length:1830 start_codon:yes stop_codon:yes gene_type:complete